MLVYVLSIACNCQMDLCHMIQYCISFRSHCCLVIIYHHTVIVTRLCINYNTGKSALPDGCPRTSAYISARVHNIYTERECPTLHMLCTNTLRKVMTQQPLTAKVLIKLKPYATLKFCQIRACNVLKMRID